MRSFIPNIMLMKRGYVERVDMDLSVAVIANLMRFDETVHEIKRCINRARAHTGTIDFIFGADFLPEYITINRVRFDVFTSYDGIIRHLFPGL